MDIKFILNKLADNNNLSKNESGFLLEEIIKGNLNIAQIAAFLVALRTKGESVDEIVSFIQIMRKHMIKIKSVKAIDIVGTGGDGTGTFNISTASGFVVAGAGVPVAKHGNRAASSKCGSADVLESLGVNINLTPAQAEKVLKKVGLVFLFAPLYHPAMKQIGPVRKELGIRTIFNFLGPFLNPAQTNKQLLGVPNIAVAEKLAKVAVKLNYKHLLLISSEDGMDEITTTAKTRIFDIKGKTVRSYFISPTQFGINFAKKQDISGSDAKSNATIISKLLKGEKGPERDIVILNSAAAFYVSGKAKNISSGIELAKQSIDKGMALNTLNNLIKETQKYA